jgi:hypothetical protein
MSYLILVYGYIHVPYDQQRNYDSETLITSNIYFICQINKYIVF